MLPQRATATIVEPMFMLRFLLIALIAMPFSSLLQPQAIGQSLTAARDLEFRIDTDVYSDESKPPVTSTKAMFLKDRALEWDDSHQRLMVIDYAKGLIELADFRSKRTCTLSMVELESKLDQLRAELSEDQIRNWASPVPPQALPDGSEVLQSERIKYQFIASRPKLPGMSSAYAEFADWSVRVAAVYPPFKPPLLRLQLNQHLLETERLPTEIKLWDLRSKNPEPIVARLLIQEGLSDQDRQRISDWSTLSATLKPVSPSEYFQSPSIANSKTTPAK
jgi:hypothetical protein